MDIGSKPHEGDFGLGQFNASTLGNKLEPIRQHAQEADVLMSVQHAGVLRRGKSYEETLFGEFSVLRLQDPLKLTLHPLIFEEAKLVDGKPTQNS
jgi:hypothetical protein